MLALLLWAAVVLAAVLAIPLRVSLTADASARPSYQVHICWLFGLVRAPLSVRASEQASPRKGSPTAGRTWSFKQTMLFVRAAGGATRARKALRDLIASLRPRVELMVINFGLDDPADTGRAFAVLAPLSVWLSLRYGQIELAPSFARAALTIDGRAHFTIVPLQTLGILLGYAMSPKTLQAFYIAKHSD